MDPGTVVVVQNRKGIIVRYEQTSKIKGTPNKKFDVDKIFHLSRNRAADEIHGDSVVDAVETDILAIKEAKADMKQLMHRHVKPRIVFHLDTDDATKIAEFKVKADKASDQGENLFIPKGAVEFELLSVATNATLNPVSYTHLTLPTTPYV